MHRLRREFSIKDLCRVIRVGRSTYYKHFNGKESPRTVENRTIMGFMLRLYGSHSKRMGVHKTKHLLEREYGIRISIGRVYRLMKRMDLPRLFFDLVDRRYNKEGSFNMVFTSNTMPDTWRNRFNEEDSLLCALDRIFDDALLFNLRGQSHRGKSLETIALTTSSNKLSVSSETTRQLTDWYSAIRCLAILYCCFNGDYLPLRRGCFIPLPTILLGRPVESMRISSPPSFWAMKSLKYDAKKALYDSSSPIASSMSLIL